jgi:hypothetical protein
VITSKANGDGAAELFKNTYTDSSTNAIAVGVSSSDLILAPGLSNTSDSFGFTVEGKPEVAVALTADIDVTLAGWAKDKNGTFYCPVTFYVNDTPVVAADKDDDKAIDQDDLAACIEAEIVKALFGKVVNEVNGEYSLIYAPNTDFSATGVGDVKVTWNWNAGNDTDDTFLGNQAAGLEGGTAATVVISYDLKAEQSMTGVATTPSN